MLKLNQNIKVGESHYELLFGANIEGRYVGSKIFFEEEYEKALQEFDKNKKEYDEIKNMTKEEMSLKYEGITNKQIEEFKNPDMELYEVITLYRKIK
jgi:hypothetical protein